MVRVLVTGYGGFLGSEITRQLLQHGFQVRGIARSNYPELQALGVETVQGSVTDRDLVLNACQGCAAVINTAAKAGVWGSWDSYYEVNTRATSHLLEGAHQHGLQAFVQTSSPSVTFAGKDQSGVDEAEPYPEKWLCFYPQTKALAEQAVLESNSVGKVASCALRPHLIWGLGDPHLFPRVVERTLQGRLRCVGDGKNLIDVVHVSNAAHAHVLALKRLLDKDQELTGQALFITDGQPVACWEWISKILEAAEVAVPKKKISFSAAYTIGACLEGIYWMLGRSQEPPMTRFVAAQLAQDHYFSLDKARRLLGYETIVDGEAEFERCKPWLKELADQLRKSPRK